jgi:hypothetical protein
MLRGRRKQHRTLGAIEKDLRALNLKRHELFKEIEAAVEALGMSAMPVVAKMGQMAGLGASLPTKGGRQPGFKMSKEARNKLAASAKRRWAEAKKAGKTTLG